MKDYDIDNYLAEINVCVDDLGGRVNLVGLCQGGWMSAMYAARFPDKVASWCSPAHHRYRCRQRADQGMAHDCRCANTRIWSPSAAG